MKGAPTEADASIPNPRCVVSYSATDNSSHRDQEVRGRSSSHKEPVARPQSTPKPKTGEEEWQGSGVGTGETAIENAGLESEEKLLRVSV